jgi:hypothetical protein
VTAPRTKVRGFQKKGFRFSSNCAVPQLKCFSMHLCLAFIPGINSGVFTLGKTHKEAKQAAKALGFKSYKPRPGYKPQRGELCFLNKKLQITLVLSYAYGSIGWSEKGCGVQASGSTSCAKTLSSPNKEGWKCFDAPGCSDSFYWDTVNGGCNECGDDPKDKSVKAIFESQIDVVNYWRKAFKKMKRIPGTTWRSANIDEYKKALAKRKGSFTLTPRGFGTGYQYSNTPSRWAKRANPKTEKFFGMPLWVTELDCD